LVWATARRSWRPVLLVLAIAVAAPAALVGVIDSLIGFGSFGLGGAASVGDELRADAGVLLGSAAITLAATIAASFVQAAGLAAAIWATTRQAATGGQVRVGDALNYGFRRAAGLWLWNVLSGLIVLVGLCACILPGIYLAFALCLVPFVVIFERGRNPIARSFQLIHSGFGPALGKVAALAGACLVYAGAVFVLLSVPRAAVAIATSSGAVIAAMNAFAAIIQALLLLPVYALAVFALLGIYAQLRGREVPLTVAQLHNELG
jgi:hypothetical protein